MSSHSPVERHETPARATNVGTANPFVADETRFIAGGGEMGQLIAATDWSKTPLGPIASWPQSLRTTVSLCVASNFPISIVWGPHRVQIYNDGYWPICAAKHPRSMGQDFKECWLSAWPVIGDAFERASKGETCFLVNQRIFLDRHGFLEETFFTFSFSPIRDETGGVGGLFHPVLELTQQSLSERRLEILRELADRGGEAKSVEDVAHQVAAALERCELDVPFALVYLLDPSGKKATLAQSIRVPAGTAASPPLVDLELPATEGWPLADALRTRQPVQIDDVEQRFGPLPCGPYPESPRTALAIPICLPAMESPLGVLVMGISSRRELDAPYRQFYTLLSEVVTHAFTKATAFDRERKRAEALAELDRAKTAFFSNVSHEFRTPLTLMLGPLEEELRNHPESSARLAVVHRNSLRLLKLVNTLLEFSRMEAGRVQTNYERTDLAAYTVELASIFRSAIEQAGLELRIDCPNLPESVHVDREMWEKIVLNLLSNAFKFTFVGHIQVALVWGGDRVELSVSDTGAGIAEAEQPKVFERFHQVRGTRSRTHEGTGIGLALVQELARLHGGAVSLQTKEGIGSTFTVSVRTGTAHLPPEQIRAESTRTAASASGRSLLEETLPWLPTGSASDLATRAAGLRQTGGDVNGAGSPVAAPPAPGGESRTARILLADDNADMRDYLQRLLSTRYVVQAVSEGAAALAAARESPPDLVLTDVMMPAMDGFELVGALRADPALSSIPIILLSARAGEEARIEGISHAADDYLVKPFSARELLARVATHLELSRTRRQGEEKLRQRKAQFETLFNEAPLGVYVVDADFRISDVNPTARPVFGNLPNLIGQDFEAAVHVLWGKEHADEIVRRFRHTLETGEPYAVPELIEQRRDRGVSEYYEWQISRIPLADGRNGVVCYFQDISARVAARTAIVNSEERFRTLVSIITEIPWTADAAGDFVTPQPAWADYTGQTWPELRGSGWMNALHPKDRPRIESLWKRACESRTLYRSDGLLWHAATGQYRFFEARATPLLHSDGTVREWVGAYADVDDDKRAAEKLEQTVVYRTSLLRDALGELEGFAYTIAHDMRAPLRAMQGYSAMLAEEHAHKLDAGGKDYLRRISASALRLDQLIRDVLNYSQIARKDFPVERVDLDLLVREIIDSYLNLRAPVAEIRIEGVLPAVLGNTGALTQCISNLLGNAVKFVSPGVQPRVTVRAEQLGSDVRLWFEDNGIGIPADAQKRIFEIFQRVHGGNAYEGTGIGLAIVKKVVDRMGGKVGLESEPGRGTRFWVQLASAGKR